MHYHVGFSGTREGLAQPQEQELYLRLRFISTSFFPTPIYFHHGRCIGADEQAAKIAHRLCFETIGHPPTDTSRETKFLDDTLREPKPYLLRNLDIIEESDELIATPKSYEEYKRSGTWHVIRHCRDMDKVLTIIYPDGRVKSNRYWPHEFKEKEITETQNV